MTWLGKFWAQRSAAGARVKHNVVACPVILHGLDSVIGRQETLIVKPGVSHSWTVLVFLRTF